MNADRYNPAALINKGNTVFVKQDYEKAAEFYKEALRNDSSCTEALYNLGNIRFHDTGQCSIIRLIYSRVTLTQSAGQTQDNASYYLLAPVHLYQV